MKSEQEIEEAALEAAVITYPRPIEGQNIFSNLKNRERVNDHRVGFVLGYISGADSNLPELKRLEAELARVSALEKKWFDALQQPCPDCGCG